MDERVLEAQRWVNATYGAVSGYQKVPEDGITGWRTMYGLTRALQHELGITALSDNFGEGTLSRLTARGGIPITETNRNIVKIVQCACYCKGYDPRGISGSFDSNLAFAVRGLMAEAGLYLDSALTVIPPKVVKALLTMDAYQQLAGGTEAVRSIQQWLNGSYVLTRANFFIIPCDGVYSRDVQKALLLAIQYTLGLTDAQATGAFGPTTRDGLKAHPVSVGSSGRWVQLFTAALVFNRIRVKGSEYATFTSSFGSTQTAAVKAFQTFSALPVTGKGDYATWCQLLVSTGNPDRLVSACDASSTITAARAAALKAAGYQIIGRYLDNVPGSSFNKKIQPGELATIFASGLRVFPISQYDGGRLSYFTYAQGYYDGGRAHTAAKGHGFNPGTVIYFAVDFDATEDQIQTAIIPYFRGVVAGLAANGKRYLHGVYGSRNVCAQVSTATLARWSFVSGMSTGFSGNMGFTLPENWAFNQIATVTVGSGDGAVQIDKNARRTSTDPGVAAVNTPPTDLTAFVAYIRRLYALAVEYDKGDPNQRVLEFLRAEEYNDLLWGQLIGSADDGFLRKVEAAGVTRIREIRDPFYGINLGVGHLAASCNGVLVKGVPKGTATNRGDVAGWGGDWFTFYGEWRRDSGTFASGSAYCREKLAKVSDLGTFKLTDLLEDADAYNLAVALRGGATLPDAIADYYLGAGFLSRMQKFYLGRFHNETDARAMAKGILLSGNDPVITWGRRLLIERSAGFDALLPSMLGTATLDDFCNGFVSTLVTLTAQENAKAAAWRREGRRL
ncbi:MAG: DUF1906 domain-containing protein [Kineosporiaceae bacterium]